MTMENASQGLAILCSGQGRQDVAYFRQCDGHPEAEALRHAVRAASVLPPAAAGWLTAPDREPDLLFRNELAQPLICLGQLMHWETLRVNLPPPDVVAGYSLGELTACGLAGCWAPVDVIRLATIRGQCMSAAVTEPQVMTAVIGLTRRRIGGICPLHQAHIAIVNGADHFVVGLPEQHAAEFETACQTAGAKRIVRLPVCVAAHTPWMRTAADIFRSRLRESPPQAPVTTLLSGVTGDRVFDGPAVIQALSDQIMTTVDWRGCLDAILSRGCRVLLELGPGDSLARMVRQWEPDLECRSVSEFHEVRAVADWVRRTLARRA